MQCVNQPTTLPQIEMNVSGVNCSDCHGVDSAFVLATDLHNLHCNPTVYGGSGCDDCHPDDSKTHTAINGIVKMKDSTTFSTTIVCDPCHGNDVLREASGW
jgi:hypothetical protein